MNKNISPNKKCFYLICDGEELSTLFNICFRCWLLVLCPFILFYALPLGLFLPLPPVTGWRGRFRVWRIGKMKLAHCTTIIAYEIYTVYYIEKKKTQIQLMLIRLCKLSVTSRGLKDPNAEREVGRQAGRQQVWTWGFNSNKKQQHRDRRGRQTIWQDTKANTEAK